MKSRTRAVSSRYSSASSGGRDVLVERSHIGRAKPRPPRTTSVSALAADTYPAMADSREIALSELIGALSSALDIAEGEPPGHAARSCLIGMRVADELGLDAAARSDLFYALLLKDAGCSANSAHMAALFGADDQEAKRTSKLVDWSRPMSAFVWSLKTVAPDGSLMAGAERLRRDPHRGSRDPVADEGALPPRRRDRAEARVLRGDGGGDPRARRALGRPRPASGLSGKEIPLAAQDHVPGADGRRVSYRARRDTSPTAWPRSEAGSGSTRRWSTPWDRSATTAVLGVVA